MGCILSQFKNHEKCTDLQMLHEYLCNTSLSDRDYRRILQLMPEKIVYVSGQACQTMSYLPCTVLDYFEIFGLNPSVLVYFNATQIGIIETCNRARFPVQYW